MNLTQGIPRVAAKLGITILAVAFAFAWRRALDPVLGETSPFMYFIFAILVAGWLAGTAYALLAVLLSAIICSYFYMEPIGSLALYGHSEFIQVGSFIILGTLVSLIVSRLRQVSRAAQNSEQRMWAIFENAAMGIVEVDENDKFILVNDRICQTLGYSRQELLNKTVHELTYPDDRPMSDQINSLIRAGTIRDFDYEKRYIKRDGTPVWAHVTVSRILNPSSGAIRHIGTIEDISERKRAEEALRASEEIALNSLAELRAIYDTAPVGLCLLDTQMRYISVNAEIARINHRPVPEHIGRTLREVLSKELADRAEPYLRRVLATGESVLHREISGEPTDDPGHIHYWLVSYYPVRVGDRIIGIGGSVQEVTEIKKAVEALRQSERLFRELADSMPQIVWAAQPDGTVDYFNHQFYELTHAPYEVSGDKSWIPILHPDDQEPSREAWYESVRTGLPFQIENRFKFPGLNEYRWHLTRALPVRDETGKITRWFGTCTDIHDQKTTQQKLTEQANALAEADRRKDEFLAMLAHELRNPLAPILYAVQMLQMKAADQPGIQKIYETIDRQARHMGRLVDDLLDMSRITRGKIQLRHELLDLRKIGESVIESMRPAIQEHKLMLNSIMSTAPVPVEGDSTRLEQIMRNLLNNAIKFTQSGGSIWVSIESEPAADGDIEAVIRVRDTGIGIDPSLLGQIFDLFAQGKQTLARTQGGLGIGLTMVKSLAELHDGRVEALSEGLDRGSEFVVYLPLAAAAPEEEVSPETQHIADGGSRRVLIVDDNEDLVSSLSELLTAWGYEVRAAFDGPQAVEAAREWIPEIILLDIGLPGMDGFEVAKILRRDQRTQKTYILALTGYGSENDRRRALEAGFNFHLTKPVETDRLKKILQNAK